MPGYLKLLVDTAIKIFSEDTGLALSLSLAQQTNNSKIEQHKYNLDGINVISKANTTAETSRNPQLSFSISSLTSKNKEKFAQFNASASIKCTIRISHEKQSELQTLSYQYLDAVVDVLSRSRGLWREGIFYAGGYDATIAPVQAGALNFIQFSTVQFELTLWQV